MENKKSIDISLRLEIRQSILRLAVLSIIFIYVATIANNITNVQLVLYFTGGFLILSVAWFFLIHFRLLNSASRRYIIIFIDAIMISVGVWLAGSDGFMFYPVYLFVTVGHGMRFGPNYLIASIIAGFLGFSVAMVASTYWYNHLTVGFALLFFLVVLPLYYLSLITKLNEANSHLQEKLVESQHNANHDQLTHLPNRRHFIDIVKYAINRTNQVSFAIIFIDLDGFKKINDVYGHESGDLVIKRVAEILSSTIRDIDTVSRLGGDEYILFIDNVEDKKIIELISERFLTSLKETYKENFPSLSASIGISMYPSDAKTVKSLLKHADQAMYNVKHNSKNNYCFFQDVIAAES